MCEASALLNVTPYSLTAPKSLMFNYYKVTPFSCPDSCERLHEPSLTANENYQCQKNLWDEAL